MYTQVLKKNEGVHVQTDTEAPRINYGYKHTEPIAFFSDELVEIYCTRGCGSRSLKIVESIVEHKDLNIDLL